MTRDYYADARAIAKCLADAGFAREASSIIDSLAAGSTGTEVLLELRWALQQIAKAARPVDPDVDAKIRDLIAAITLALKP